MFRRKFWTVSDAHYLFHILYSALKVRVNVAERQSAINDPTCLTAALKDLARRAFGWAALMSASNGDTNCPWAKTVSASKDWLSGIMQGL